MQDAVIGEIWSELKRYISTVDRTEAADTMVSIMIDNDFDVDDIRQIFKGDSDIKRAIADYVSDDKESYEDEDEDEDEYLDEEDY